MKAKGPDEFLLDLVDLDNAAVYAALRQIADSWRNPPGTIADVLRRLENDGLVETAAALRT